MTLYDNFKVLFTKQGELGKDFSPFINNMFYSFSSQTLPIALKLDKYIFWLDKDIMTSIINATTPKMRQPWFKYIKKPKTEKNKILLELQKIYKWTDRQRDAQSRLLDTLLSDDRTLTSLLRMIGADEKTFKEYKVKMEEPKEEGSLKTWMKN